jgi:hypothetical protein
VKNQACTSSNYVSFMFYRPLYARPNNSGSTLLIFGSREADARSAAYCVSGIDLNQTVLEQFAMYYSICICRKNMNLRQRMAHSYKCKMKRNGVGGMFGRKLLFRAS